MKRPFVAGAAIIGTALFAYSINALGFAKIQEAFVRMGWGFGAILLLSGAREAVRTLAWRILSGEPMKAEHVSHRLPFATAFSALVVEFAFYGVSLVLLFSAGIVTLFPSSAVLFVAVIVLMIVPLVRNGNGR